MNKVVLITGSGKERVGNYVAHYLAERGYDIAIHYNSSRQDAEATVKQLSKKVRAAAFQADITQPKEVRTLVDKVVKEFGRIDVLVNAAAAFKATKLEDLSSDLAMAKQYLDFFNNVNLAGTYLVSLAVGDQMLKQGKGNYSIINIADWAVSRPYRNYFAYHPSKGGVLILTRALANELAPGIRINSISPGPVMLPKDMPRKEKKKAIKSTLLKREGNPKNIAQTVLFLIENDYVTGVNIPVDGGKTVKNDE